MLSLNPRRARVALWVVLSLAAAGCTGDAASVRWAFVFESAALRERAVAVTASVRTGGCDGPSVYDAELRSGVTLPAPGPLAPGTYGLVGRARDRDCMEYAEGCVVVVLPAEESREEVIVLAAIPPTATCPAAECDEGSCGATPEVDGGPPILLDGCVPGVETCNGTDDDCDARADEDFDLTSDPVHCGECDTVCDAGGICLEGTCLADGPVDVAAGSEHSCAAYVSGKVACWGDNAIGQLGDGTSDAHAAPILVPGVEDATQIAAGARHTCARRRSGAVVCWGKNDFGQLGDGSSSPFQGPTEVFGITDATDINLGGDFSCVTSAGGTASCWGVDHRGQLGNGIGRADGAVPTPVMMLASARRVGANHVSACAATDDGSVWCWGKNENGEAGSDTTRLDVEVASFVPGVAAVTQVSAGWNHACARAEGGGVWCWGDGQFGQLGNGSRPMASSPVAVLGIDDAERVVAGSYFNCVLRTGGRVRCWGYGEHGQVGDGTTGTRLVPGADLMLPTVVAISEANRDHVCVATEAREVHCWGINDLGQLGPDGPPMRSTTPVRITGLP